jgi:large conductance mechanosensitive channel
MNGCEVGRELARRAQVGAPSAPAPLHVRIPERHTLMSQLQIVQAYDPFMFAEFRGFLTKTNALALAVGVIIGAAVGRVVTSLVEDVLMPVIGLALPGGDWRAAKIVLDATNSILYGKFLGTIIDFVVISFVVFPIVRALVKPAPVAEAEQMRKCPECLEMIPSAARRCRACTAAVA